MSLSHVKKYSQQCLLKGTLRFIFSAMSPERDVAFINSKFKIENSKNLIKYNCPFLDYFLVMSPERDVY